MVNVLDFYGGNENKMREEEQAQEEVNFERELRKMNRNMHGNLVKTPKPFK